MSDTQPRLLVAIANHGHKNHKYVSRLIEAYRSFSFPVHIVILSNVEKDLGPDVEVIVGVPSSNPWSLPFGHRKLFEERQDEYDLFIYSEDDTEILEEHIWAFLDATSHLPKDKIAGFIRYEEGPDGTRYYSTVHGAYYWDPNSILKAGGHVYARYTNDHSACYVITRDQLKTCIASGNFVVPPYEGRYDMLCSAATDPYTKCGFEKLVRISDLAGFSLHHLPDKYLGAIGVETEEIDAQIACMLELAESDAPRGPLFEPEAKFKDTGRFDKKFFEPLREEVVGLFPPGEGSVLSIGCERGLTEEKLIERGRSVTAVPLDAVIAVSARMRGVRTTPPDYDLALEQLAGERFDTLLFNNVLHYMPDPVAVIAKFTPLLAPGGEVVISYDNFRHVGQMWRRMKASWPAGARAWTDSYAHCGVRPVHAGMARAWMRRAGLTPGRSVMALSERGKALSAKSMGLAEPLLAQSGAVVGRKG